MTPEYLINKTRLESKLIKEIIDKLQQDIDEKIEQAEHAACRGDMGRAGRLLIETATLRKAIKYGKRE